MNRVAYIGRLVRIVAEYAEENMSNEELIEWTARIERVLHEIRRLRGSLFVQDRRDHRDRRGDHDRRDDSGSGVDPTVERKHDWRRRD